MPKLFMRYGKKINETTDYGFSIVRLPFCYIYFVILLVGNRLLRLRKNHFYHITEAIFTPHAFAVARSRHTRMAFCSLSTHFVCFANLFVGNRLLRLGLDFFDCPQVKIQTSLAETLSRGRHTRYAFCPLSTHYVHCVNLIVGKWFHCWE